MYCKKNLSAWSLAALAIFSPAITHASPSAAGTAYFDLTGLTAALQSGNVGFGGWQFASAATVTVDAVSESKNVAIADLSVSAANTSASLGPAQISVETGVGGLSQAYQEMNATIRLAPGQHFFYSVAYSLSLYKGLLPEQVAVGVGISLEDEFGSNGVGNTVSTLGWQNAQGSDGVSNVLQLDFYNPYDYESSYALKGWLGAAVSSPGSVVPEPSAYLLLLAGLGAVAVVARRRTGQNALVASS